MLYWDESMSESAADMDHRLTITGMQDTVGSRTAGGLDILYTKLAVDLQNMVAGQADPVLAAALETLRDELGCDATCVALFGENGRRIERVIAARSTFAICNPEVLTWPWRNFHGWTGACNICVSGVSPIRRCHPCRRRLTLRAWPYWAVVQSC